MTDPVMYNVASAILCRSLAIVRSLPLPGCDIRLKTLLQQGISEPIFYGDLVYKFKRISGRPNFSDQLKR